VARRQPLGAQEREDLTKALLSGFPTRERLDALLDFGLDKRPDDYPGAVSAAVQKLVTDVNADDGVTRLVTQAVKRTPNASLRAFHDEYFALVSPEARGPSFQSQITGLGFQNLGDWIDRATAIKAQVCRVEVGNATGTGFLVGPDLVITNYHVIESVVGSQSPGVVLRFDLTAPGRAGSERTLAAEWLVEFSRYSAVDLDENATSTAPANELDYAVLRTKAAVGDEPVNQGRRRGWQAFSKQAPICTEGAPLVIVQHPQGEHMQMALDTNAILKVGPTRVRYRTNTKHGSSGSPCFDLAWNLLALHHSGDQSFKAIWNEGIPVRSIADSATLSATGGS
jgi:V8-like Glu-specific endopeptidase